MPTNDDERVQSASAIETASKRFGMPASRASEIAAAVEHYEGAMNRRCASAIIDCDPMVLMQTLVDLGRL